MERELTKMIEKHQTTRPKGPLQIVERCSFCDQLFSIHTFRDKLNYKEFITSGLCQKCQDETSEDGK